MSGEPGVIVAGAGPAAAVAASEVARGGSTVLWMPTCEAAGRPPSGGRLDHASGRILDEWLRGPGSNARRLVEERVLLLREGTVSLDERRSSSGSDGASSRFLIGSAELAEWFGARARERGASVDTETKVLGLERDARGRTVGVHTSEGVHRAPITIAAAPLAVPAVETTGVHRRPLSPAARSTLARFREFRAPSGSIERRFAVGATEGATIDFFLDTDAPGVLAGGWLVTHGSSVSVGVQLRGVNQDPTVQLADQSLSRLLALGATLPLLRGWSPREDGWSWLPPFTGSAASLGDRGLLRIGAAAGFSGSATSFVPRIDAAVRSAVCAARAVRSAGSSGPADAGLVPCYRAELEREGLLREFTSERWLVDRLKWNPRWRSKYAAFADDLLHAAMSETGSPKESVRHSVARARRQAGLRWTDAARDFLGSAP